MKPQPLNLNMERDVRRISEYITEIVSEAFRMMEEDKRELQETIKTEVCGLLDKVEQHIKSACEFYLKYKDKPDLLVKRYPEYKADLTLFTKDVPFAVPFDERLFNPLWFDYDRYNEWLFKLAFKDVLKGDKR